MINRILLADDHGIVRIGASLIIKEVLGDYTIIEEATTFDQALDLLKKNAFNLIVLDINLPGGNNINMIDAIKLRSPSVKILVFSSYDESVFAIRYIKAGANGYLNKESSESELKKAIVGILNGGIYMSEALKDKQLLDMATNKPSTNELENLSNRELEVINLLIKGNTTSEIAEKLSIRLNTVSTYKSTIYQKMEVNNLVDLISKVKLYTPSL